MRFVAPLLCLLIGLAVSLPAFAVHEKADGFPWNLSLRGEHDKPLLDKLGQGFFMNVGPTGIRARITKKHPSYFTVRFVFERSPAAGKVKAGDIIVGANGRVMDVPHRFGRGSVSGWDGPMQEMAKLIEDSQGKDGRLELIVWPSGDKARAKKVVVQIPAVGRFAKTFPYDCERSDRLMIQLCDFLQKEHGRKGSFSGQRHVHTASLLALMASGQEKYTPIIRREMAKYPGKRYDSLIESGYQCWNYGLDGLVIGEYYRLSRDKAMVPLARQISRSVEESQNPIHGGFSHKPFPVIARRVANGGGWGYGPLSSVTAMIMLGQSTFKATGLDYSEAAYERMHRAWGSGWTGSGYLGYGMTDWPHVFVRPTGKIADAGGNKKGVGYVVPKGVSAIAPFRVVDGKQGGRDTNWLRDPGELSRAACYQVDDNLYLIVRDMSDAGTLPNAKGDRVMHSFRSGCAALAYGIGNEDSRSWQKIAGTYAKACADRPDAILDGHASTLMHTLWGSLGAARADRKSFQRYMQGMKWWFIMAQTHDGSYVAMPGRDYAASDVLYAGRNLPTATAAIILSVKERRLMMTGARSGGAGGSAPASQGPAANAAQPEPAARAGLGTQAQAILGPGFKTAYFQREAKLLEGKTPYDRILQTLDRASSGADAKSQEAKAFAQRLRSWIAGQNAAYLKLAKTRPATMLGRSADYVNRLGRLEDPASLRLKETSRKLGADSDTRALSRYYAKQDQIAAQEANRGASESTVRQTTEVLDYVRAYLRRPGLSEVLKKEAVVFLASVKPSALPDP